jgi:hypothetical protein
VVLVGEGLDYPDAADAFLQPHVEVAKAREDGRQVSVMRPP